MPRVKGLVSETRQEEKVLMFYFSKGTSTVQSSFDARSSSTKDIFPVYSQINSCLW